jgi:nicotinamide-nucleotide amidase
VTADPHPEADPAALAPHAVLTLRRAGGTLAIAESLTGGLLTARVVDVPGASAVLRGGVVAYATELKHTLLGVDPDLLRLHGPVHPAVATAMAEGVRDRLGATWGLSTTGVAGPDPQDGQRPGTVHIGLAGPGGVRVVSLRLAGTRQEIRGATVDAALGVLLG